MGQFDSLFEPLVVNQVTLRNRIVSTSHSEVYGRDGFVTDRLIAYHAEKARGGIGMTMCGGSSSVSIDSPIGWWNSLTVATDEAIPGLRRLADAVHGHGAALTLQITHMGRRSRWDGQDWPSLVSPSGLREPVHRANCKVMEIEDIQRIVHDFGQAARRVREAGLDGIEVSCAHQHLVDQFWSPVSNRREDDYGGSLENRLRFGFEVFEEIRRVAGRDFMVGMRMCGDEFHEEGLHREELLEIARRYAGSGLIDFISVIGSGADTNALTANLVPNMAYPPAPFLYLASGIRAAVDLPVIHAQNIKDPVSAARILDEGHVDLVGMTRAHIADPHLVAKTREGRHDQIRLCVGANYCINRMYAGLDVACVQNAATGRETTLPHRIGRAPQRRRIAIVGAGPGGMEAARVCGERGHEVILIERSARLGGQINLAAAAPAREQMAQITHWLGMQLDLLRADIRLETAADPQLLRSLAPDIVILATGGRPSLAGFEDQAAELPGRVVSAHDILAGSAAPAANVLLYDIPGTHAGATCADLLASRGSLVELVSPDPGIGEELGGTVRPVYHRRLFEQEVILTPNFALRRIYPEQDKLVAVLRNEYTEQEEERLVDQIVVENGVTPDETLYHALKPASRNRGQVDLEALFAGRPQPPPAFEGDFLLYRIGDCVSARDIHAAIYDALRLCRDF